MKRLIISSSSNQYTWNYGKSSGTFEQALKYYTSFDDVDKLVSNVLSQPFNNLTVNGTALFKVDGQLIVKMKDSTFHEINSAYDFIEMAIPSGEIRSMSLNDKYNKPDQDYFQQNPDMIPDEYASLYRKDDSSYSGSRRTIVSPGGKRTSAYDREWARAQATGNKWAMENFKATH